MPTKRPWVREIIQRHPGKPGEIAAHSLISRGEATGVVSCRGRERGQGRPRDPTGTLAELSEGSGPYAESFRRAVGRRRRRPGRGYDRRPRGGRAGRAPQRLLLCQGGGSARKGCSMMRPRGSCSLLVPRHQHPHQQESEVHAQEERADNGHPGPGHGVCPPFRMVGNAAGHGTTTIREAGWMPGQDSLF